MAYKIKSLMYFLGLLAAILLYYSTEQNADQIEQQIERSLVENENPTEKHSELN
jgi:predicted histidine transporter YuiF (NhaC family)